MSDFIIPIDEAIGDFEKHLQANPRTILSSKFGDGKSYFLDKIRSSDDLKKTYEFLTIFPVNYQVVGNKDIFEILKRDILFQLLLHDMISDRVQMTRSEALSWFVYKKGINFISDIIQYLSEVGLEPEDCSKILMAIKGLKLFKSIQEKYEEFKSAEIMSDDDRLCSFLDNVEKSFIYESDVITSFIKKSIKDFRQRTGKQIVLIIEDMDRIDPAHLFRILNVLSAHMDYSYKCFVKPDFSLVGNKFGLDNIVLVVDFDNLKRIYHHFYGIHTDFKGYISKFLSSIPFNYSLEAQKNRYVLRKLSEITDFPSSILKDLFPLEIVASATMREIVQSFNIEKQITVNPVVSIEGNNVKLNDSVLRVMAVMRRMKLTNAEIVEKILEILTIDRDLFVNRVCPYLFFSKGIGKGATRRIINIKDKNRGLVKVEVILDVNTGNAMLNDTYWRAQSEDSETKFDECIQNMLSYLA